MSEQALAALAAAIDHTLLKPEATRQEIRTLCAQARQWRFAAVCVNPLWVEEAAALLTGAEVKVATVVAFPLGAMPASAKAREAQEACQRGAQELDVVVSLGLLFGGEDEAFQRDLEAVVAVAREHRATVKAILETGLLSEAQKKRAARAAVAAGVDFLKTSTGFASSGATVEDVALLRRLAPPRVGVKASGGIRTFAQARAMLAAGASRLGTSAGVAIMEQAQAWYAGS